MANVSKVNGFRPVKHTNGSPWNGQVNLYQIPASDATATFVGDLVKLNGTASTDGYATVQQAAAGNTPVGVVVGFMPTNLTPGGISTGSMSLDTPIFRAASTARYVWVADSPDLVMEAQEDAVGGALALADVGNNINFIVGAGSTVSGASGMQVQSNSKAVTSTLPLRLIGFVNRPDNDIGNANSKVQVAFNVHQYGSVGTAGV